MKEFQKDPEMLMDLMYRYTFSSASLHLPLGSQTCGFSFSLLPILLWFVLFVYCFWTYHSNRVAHLSPAVCLACVITWAKMPVHTFLWYYEQNFIYFLWALTYGLLWLQDCKGLPDLSRPASNLAPKHGREAQRQEVFYRVSHVSDPCRGPGGWISQHAGGSQILTCGQRHLSSELLSWVGNAPFPKNNSRRELCLGCSSNPHTRLDLNEIHVRLW